MSPQTPARACVSLQQNRVWIKSIIIQGVSKNFIVGKRLLMQRALNGFFPEEAVLLSITKAY